MSKKNDSPLQNTKDSDQGFRIPRNLRFRIHEGKIYACASQNLGEFVVGLEIIELLRIIDENSTSPHPESKHSAAKWRNSLMSGLKEALRYVPTPLETQILLDELAAAGVVNKTNPNLQTLPQENSGDRFADGWIQWAMISDQVRSESYLQAIQKVIRKGEVCLDLGAGSGLLSFFLLKSGAARVVAIEESAAAVSLQRTFRRLKGHFNGSLEKRLKVIRSNSADVEVSQLLEIDTPAFEETEAVKASGPATGAALGLPTLLVSELFGHDPFSEGVVPALYDMQKRLVEHKVIARSIPKTLRLLGCFARLDPSKTHLATRISRFSKATLDKSTPEEIPLEAFEKSFMKQENWDTLSFPFALRNGDFKVLGPEMSLFHLVLDPVPQTAFECRKTKTTLRLPELDEHTVLLVWFESELAPGIVISSLPGKKESCQHWEPIVFPLLARPTTKTSAKDEASAINPMHLLRGKQAHVEVWLSESLNHFHLRLYSDLTTLAAR